MHLDANRRPVTTRVTAYTTTSQTCHGQNPLRLPASYGSQHTPLLLCLRLNQDRLAAATAAGAAAAALVVTAALYSGRVSTYSTTTYGSP